MEVITSQDYYGPQGSQEVEDEDWIELTAEEGWIAVSNDKLLNKPTERDTIARVGARCFVFESGEMTGEELAELFIYYLTEILRICEQPGPFLWIIREAAIQRVDLGVLPSSNQFQQEQWEI